MATTVKRLTYDDLEAIPQEREGDLQELIDGELVVTPVPLIKHQIVSMNIISALDRFVRDGGLGRVLHAPTGVRLTPDNLLIPDIVFIAKDRLISSARRPSTLLPIWSWRFFAGNRRRICDQARALCALRRAGILDRRSGRRTVSVLALAGDKYEPVPGGEGGAITSRVLPGLTLALKDVFAGVER